MRIQLIFVVLAACSSSKQSSPPPSKIASLSKDESRQLCERIAAYRKATAAMPGFAKIRCGTTALGAAGSRDNTTADAMRKSCDREYAACLATGPTLPGLDCTASGFMDQMAQCSDLTADELFACTEEMRSMLATVASQDPCATPFDPQDTLASYNGYLAKLKGPRCAVVDQKCKH